MGRRRKEKENRIQFKTLSAGIPSDYDYHRGKFYEIGQLGNLKVYLGRVGAAWMIGTSSGTAVTNLSHFSKASNLLKYKYVGNNALDELIERALNSNGGLGIKLTCTVSKDKTVWNNQTINA